MLNFFNKLLGKKSVDFRQIVQNGAQIVDVRTPAEYNNGHISNSENIPLQDLKNKMKKLDLKKPVITCCASGMRSASAKIILKDNGFEVYDGGGWSSLKNKINN